MNSLREYKVAFRGLKAGNHRFDFHINSDFFRKFRGNEDIKTELDVEVTLKKTSLLMELTFILDGKMKTFCDRCLGEMEIDVKGKMSLYVKEGNPNDSNLDDFLVVSKEDDYLDLSSYIYEVFITNIPLKTVHNEGDCDEDMEEILSKYIITQEDKGIDPRWNELKKLINN